MPYYGQCLIAIGCVCQWLSLKTKNKINTQTFSAKEGGAVHMLHLTHSDVQPVGPGSGVDSEPCHAVGCSEALHVVWTDHH